MTDGDVFQQIRSSLTVLKAEAAGLRFSLAMDQMAKVLGLHRCYNPNWQSQPRVPAGNPDGGRWTESAVPAKPGDRARTEALAETMRDFLDDPLVAGEAYAQVRRSGGSMLRVGGRLRELTPAQATRYDVENFKFQLALTRVRRIDPHWRPTPQITSTIEGEITALRAMRIEAEVRYRQLTRAFGHPEGRPDLTPAPRERFPTVSERRPPRMRDENRLAKEFARIARHAGHILDLFEAARPGSWVHEHFARIESYLDQPRSLEELQRLVAKPDFGYDIHHIVEQGPARQDGFPEIMIHGRENRVRIPTYKH